MRNKFVNVLGKTYTIRFVKKARMDSEEEYGICDFSKTEILVNRDFGKDHQKDTVIHEIVHAIDEDLDLGFSEKQVRNLGCALYQVFKANPKLRRWLFTNRRRAQENEQS